MKKSGTLVVCALLFGLSNLAMAASTESFETALARKKNARITSYSKANDGNSKVIQQNAQYYDKSTSSVVNTGRSTVATRLADPTVADQYSGGKEEDGGKK